MMYSFKKAIALMIIFSMIFSIGSVPILADSEITPTVPSSDTIEQQEAQSDNNTMQESDENSLSEDVQQSDTNQQVKANSTTDQLKKNLEKKMTTMPLTVTTDLIKEFSKDLFPGVSAVQSLLGGVIGGIFALFELDGSSGDKTSEQLSEISTKLDSLSQQLDNATTEIIGQVEKNTLSRKIDAIGEEAKALDSSANHNVAVADAIRLTQQNATDAGSQATIKIGFTNVYNTENNQFSYYDNLTDFGNSVIGNKIIISDKDLYTLYQGYASYVDDWNTMTFDERSQFNDAVTQFFLSNYANVKAAILYDREMHESELALQNEYIEALNSIIANDTVNETDLAQAQTELNNASSRVGQLNVWINQANSDEQRLDALKDNVAQKYQAASDTLINEKTNVEQGKIYNYRVQKNYQTTVELSSYEALRGQVGSATMTPYSPSSLDPNNRVLKDAATENDLTTMNSAAVKRGYPNLYEELLVAGFTMDYMNTAFEDKFKMHYEQADVPIGFGIHQSAWYTRTGNVFSGHKLDYYAKILNVFSGKVETIRTAYIHNVVFDGWGSKGYGNQLIIYLNEAV